MRAWTRRLRAWTWPGCVRRRGWDPSQKVAGPDEGQVDAMRLWVLAQGWCKKPRVSPLGLHMWTWPGPPSQKVTGPDEGQADLKRLFSFNVVKEDTMCCDAGM